MHIGRCDVPVTARRVGKLQRSWTVNAPRTFQRVGNSEPDRRAAVVSEIEIIVAEPAGQPVRRADQGWPIDVVAFGPIQHRGADDRILRETPKPKRGPGKRGHGKPTMDGVSFSGRLNHRNMLAR